MSIESKTCPFCDKLFPNEVSIKNHIGVIHLGFKLNDFEGHEKKIELSDETSFSEINKIEVSKCPDKSETNKTFGTNEDSEARSHSETDQNCEFCGKTFTGLHLKHDIQICENLFNEKYSGNEFKCKY